MRLDDSRKTSYKRNRKVSKLANLNLKSLKKVTVSKNFR